MRQTATVVLCVNFFYNSLVAQCILYLICLSSNLTEGIKTSHMLMIIDFALKL